MVGEHTHSLVVLRDGVLDLHLYVNLAIVRHGWRGLSSIEGRSDILSPSLHDLRLLSKPCHHLCIRELLPVDTNMGTVLTLLGSKIRQEVFHRPFTPGLELLEKFRCQPQILCGQLVLLAKVLHQPDLPGFLEHLQFLLLGAQDFQSGAPSLVLCSH